MTSSMRCSWAREDLYTIKSASLSVNLLMKKTRGRKKTLSAELLSSAKRT
jgi:hypothetical protein